MVPFNFIKTGLHHGCFPRNVPMRTALRTVVKSHKGLKETETFVKSCSVKKLL